MVLLWSGLTRDPLQNFSVLISSLSRLRSLCGTSLPSESSVGLCADLQTCSQQVWKQMSSLKTPQLAHEGLLEKLTPPVGVYSHKHPLPLRNFISCLPSFLLLKNTFYLSKTHRVWSLSLERRRGSGNNPCDTLGIWKMVMILLGSQANSLSVRGLDLEPDTMVRPVCGYNVVVWVL